MNISKVKVETVTAKAPPLDARFMCDFYVEANGSNYYGLPILMVGNTGEQKDWEFELREPVDSSLLTDNAFSFSISDQRQDDLWLPKSIKVLGEVDNGWITLVEITSWPSNLYVGDSDSPNVPAGASASRSYNLGEISASLQSPRQHSSTTYSTLN